MVNNKIEVKAELLEGIRKLCQSDRDIVLVSLCTTDGFAIKAFASKELSGESDKLAAMSSTISALGNSSAEQVLNNEFDVTIVESANGNILFVRASYLSFSCVLTVAAKQNMTLALARYKTKALAEKISQIN